jgi:hypothetical protein
MDSACRAEIVRLRDKAAEFRCLAQQRQDADQACISKKLIEVAAQLDRKASQLEASAA